MPRIPTYESQTRAPGPVEYRGGNRGSIGPGLKRLGEAVGTAADAVFEREQQAETSEASASLAELNAKKAIALDEKGRDPNAADDKNLADDFVSDYEKQLADIEAKTTTPGASRYVKDAGAKSKAHFMESASAVQAELAGVKAVENYTKGLNSRSTAIQLSPSSYDFHAAEQAAEDVRTGESHSLKTEEFTKLRMHAGSALAESAIRGWIKVSGVDSKGELKEAREVIKDPKWSTVMSGDLMHQLQGEIIIEENSRRLQREQARREQERLYDEKQKSIQNNAFTEFFKGTPASQIIRDIGTKPGLDPEKRVATMNAIDKLNDDRNKPDPGVFNEVFAKIQSGEIVDDQGLYPYIGHGIDKSDYSFLVDRLRGSTQEKEMISGLDKVAKAHFKTGSELTGFTDPLAETLYQKWTLFAAEEIKEGLKKGKTRTQLTNPESPDYIGKHLLTDPAFQRSADEIGQDIMRERGVGFRPTVSGKPISYVDDKLSGSAPQADPRPSPSPSVVPSAPQLLQTSEEASTARKPGESIKEWKARVKGK